MELTGGIKLDQCRTYPGTVTVIFRMALLVAWRQDSGAETYADHYDISRDIFDNMRAIT